MPASVLITTATRGSRAHFTANTLLGRSLAQPQHSSYATEIQTNNTQPLALTYNRAIEQAAANTLLVFCHDDVWLGEQTLAPLLEEGLKCFDLIGVAGNSRMLPGHTSWCCRPNSTGWDTPHLVGAIAHGDPETNQPTAFGPSPAEAVLLDGVFLAAYAGLLQQAELRFDPQFDFHFYDLDLSRAARVAGLQLGVWPIPLIHASGGNPGSASWYRNLQLYCSKWGESPPPPASTALHNARTPAAMTTTPSLEITTSRQLLDWLTEQQLSIALTTYQIGKLFSLGLKANGELSVFERTFNRCMGLCNSRDGNGFFMSSLHQIWRFENMLAAGETADGFDRLYVPQVGNTTGDCDIHDMAVNSDGQLVFVNTLFSCLATTSDTHSFRPIWQPPFISKLAAEDRCHLNGLAIRDGEPAYVTAVATSDAADGWREHRADGGVVIDVASNSVIASGLSMPHSPRWYQDRLWLCNSGTGEFGSLDLNSGTFEPLTFCAGYLRGVAFHGDYALLGTSKPRHNKTFSGLPLDQALAERNVEARCGIQVVDLRSGDAVHWIRFEGVVDELYDVIALPGVRNPSLIGFVSDDIRRLISIDE